MPCNLNQRALAQHVKRGIRDAGGTPMEFNTIAVSDGVSMGTEGMRASLVSREVIADSIELVARGHLFDGLVCLVGCDKTIPAAVMALARLDLPGLALYNGSIAPGSFKGKDVTIQDVFEAVGAHAAGTMSGAEVHALESVACPGAGACGGQFTANTMATALDFLGISPAGLNGIPALHPTKEDAAYEAGSARDAARARRRPAVADHHARGARQRRRVDRRQRRLDERRAARARDRTRAGDPVHARGLRRGRGADAGGREPEARRPLRRNGHARRGRRRARRARAAEAGRPPHRLGAERRRPLARSDRGSGRGDRRARRSSSHSRRR